MLPDKDCIIYTWTMVERLWAEDGNNVAGCFKGVVCLDDGVLSACRRNRLMFTGERSVLSGGFRRLFEPACLHMVSSRM